MEMLEKVVSSFSKEEQRNFKLFALRSHEDKTRKDIQLFDILKKEGENFNERKALKKIYGSTGRINTYHRLRNRLLTELGKSVALLYWEKDETASSLHFLTLSLLYRKKQLFQISAYYLSKAERKADRLDFPELLDLIYGEFITLSFELSTVNPESYVQKRSENRIRLNQLWEIDNLLAIVNHRLRHSQNLGRGNQEILTVLSKTVQELSLHPKIMADPKFKLRMYNAVSKIMLEKRDYLALEAYLLQTFETFSKERLFNKSNHETKLQMLTYIVNALFKNGKIEASLNYAEKLKVAMEEHGQLLKTKYLFFYYNSLFLNYSSKDFSDAIKVLERMLEIDEISAVPQYLVYIYLNLAVSEYARKKHKSAIKHLVKLGLQEAFAGTDEGFRFRITIFELALRFDLEEIETLEYRIQQVRQDYADLLENESMEKDAQMLDFIQAMCKDFPNWKSPQLAADIEAFVDKFPADDTEIFKYGEFLLGKI